MITAHVIDDPIVARISEGSVNPSINNPIVIIDGDPYEGEYEVVPRATSQILSTQGKKMEHDLVIEAIPNNYGLITWNGSFLTVS